MAKIAFLEVETADRRQIDEHYPGSFVSVEPVGGNGVLAACADTEILSCFIYSQLGGKELNALPRLKLLITRSVGYDHIDLKECDRRGVTVCNVPDYGSHVIAEHVFALLLSALRHIPEADKRVESGVFDYHGLRGMALRGKTMGIVGTGKIGRNVAGIAHGFGMEIIATDMCRVMELIDLLGVEYVPFEALLARSDIITLHIPATPDTEHIVDAAAFRRMKKGVVLVNTARGSLIDSAALLQALNDGRVSHALLDVLEHEQNFEENRALIGHPNVVTTPHIGFYADDSLRNMYLDCFESIEQHRRGEKPEHEVHPLKIVCDSPALKRA